MKALGIDIGGSAVKGAPVDTRTGELLAERFRLPTPTALTPRKMAEAIDEIRAHFRWRGPIGVGFPGVIHGPRIMTSANLHPDFVECDAAKLFGQETGCRVELVNDADAAGIAEMMFGAGQNMKGTVLVLTLGTGVGSALFYRGQLYPNTEMGHLPMKGKSAEKFVAAAAREEKDLGWEEWATQLNAYIGTLETLLWPELIIIGGGVSAKHRKFFQYLKPRARLVPAEFFNEAGIVGAALWAVGKKL